MIDSNDKGYYMKRRKIAAFVNDWSDSYAMTVISGIEKCAKEKNVDVYIFADFSCGTDEKDIHGELNIQALADLEEFDGAIMMSNTFNFQYAIFELKDRIDAVGIPSVTLEYEINGMDFFGTENTAGMMELTDHLIEKHGAKDIVVITGHSDNKESQERLAAVRKSMENHGLQLPDKNVLAGEFSDVVAMAQIEKWYKAEKSLPDAIVCANDIMALGVLNYMDSIGVKVPEAVMVTGYDHIEAGINCSPSLTTVGRDWTSLGYQALVHVLDKIDGKPVQSKNMMKSQLVISESCGCEAASEDRPEGIQQSTYGKKKNSMDFDSHNRALYMYLRNTKNLEGISQSLNNFLARNNVYEGKTCCICLVDEFFSSPEKGALPVDGYGEMVHVVGDVKNNVANPYKKILSKQIIPWDNAEEKEGHFYIIVPLHSDEHAMGYAVFEDNLFVVDNYILYTWTRHVNQYLEQVRTNMRVEQLTEQLRVLSVTDALTGIYNRMGYKEFAIPYLEENRKNGKNTVLMIADINRMKVINDRFGHAQGDLAIMLVAKALRKALKDWILVRYGGDEFLMVGDCDTKEQARRIKNKIHEALEDIIKEANIAFPLSVSVGSVIIEQSSTLSVEDCFKKADRSMYRIKKKHHEMEKENQETE